MKKLFTLALALLGFAGVTNAASVDDLEVCKHSYVLCFDDWDGNGTAKPGKGQLFGNGFFLDVTGGSVSTGKGKVNLSVVNEADDNHVTQYIADKYGADYPDDHFNSWRLKNDQDVIAMKVTANSKLIFFLQGNNKSGKEARIPKISKNADLSDPLNEAPGEDHPTTDSGFRFEWTAPDDMTIYIGTYNGDTFFSYLIVEANEAPGTPTVKVGDQQFEGGLWFREVTCKANPAVEDGVSCPTVVTYTTDGTMPTAASPVYTEPIKCYKDMTVKFQAFLDLGDGKPSADLICDGADNDGNVNFKFDAPTISADGATFSITSPYAEQNGKNYFTLTADGQTSEPVQGDGTTLDLSATVSAYTVISNGEYGEFTSMPTTKDVYVLNPIKEKKTIAVTAGDIVEDAEATATSTTGPVYKVENGEISADKKDFFVKNLEFGVVKDAAYQIDGKEAYIKMNNTNITFKVAAGDKVKVKVVCSKNSCKNLEADDAAEDKLDNGCTPDRQCYVNVSGTNYCLTDAEGKHTNDLKLYPDANVFEFELAGGKNVTNKDEEGNDVTTFEAADTYYTFQKYSGTGNILISSIEIEPVAATPAETETVLWEGTALVNGWADQPYLLSDGGKELTDNNAKAGDKIRFYCSAPDDNWQMELTSGHWDGMYFRYAPKDQGPEADGSARAYEIVDISNGYFDFVVTDEFLAKATASQGWGGVFVLNGDGNLTVTKLTLVQGGATGIAPVKTVKAQSSAIYNLAGQRVDANYKGVVIMNGKKVVIK